MQSGILHMDRVKRIWYLSPMRAAKVQASLRIRAVSPEPPLLAHTSSESRGTFRQKARSLAQLNGWACAVEICHDGMHEDTNSLDGAQISRYFEKYLAYNLKCQSLLKATTSIRYSTHKSNMKAPAQTLFEIFSEKFSLSKFQTVTPFLRTLFKR